MRLAPVRVARCCRGMVASFKPDDEPREIVMLFRIRTRGEQHGYYMKLAGQHKGEVFSGGKRIWIATG